MDPGQPQGGPRSGIISSLASSLINVLQPLATRPQDTPQSDRHVQERRGSAGTPPAITNPAVAQLSRPRQTPSPAGEPRPSHSRPGTQSSGDYPDVAMADRARQAPTRSAAHVTAAVNQLNYRASEPFRPGTEHSGNSSNHNPTITFPEFYPPLDGINVESHSRSRSFPGPTFDPTRLAAGPPSRGHSPLPHTPNQVSGGSFGRSSESSTNSPQLDSTPTASLRVPAISSGNRSQDRLSTASSGGVSVNSPEKKRLSSFLGSAKSTAKTLFKTPPPTPPTSRFDSPGPAPLGKLRTAVAFQRQDMTLDVLDSEVGYFQNVELHSSTSWDDIYGELMLLPAFETIVSCLHRVFGAVDNIRTYRGQWGRLRGNCVVASRLLAHQYERYQNEPERLQLLDKVCSDLGTVVMEISNTARKWSEKNAVEAFVCYDLMDKALRMHFTALGDVMQAMISTSQVLNETWTSEIAKHQKEEREQLEMIHTLLKDQNASLVQLAQAIQSKDDLIIKLIGENETTIGRFLGQQMAQFQQAGGDAEDIDRLIQMIVQITGVELPTEVFQTEHCTNIPEVEPIHGHSSTVYKARLSRGQLVAKKVFYLNKYSEGDVKTYAMKMTRDAKQWRVFDSEYTLKYMLSPWMENMDTLKYLKDRRGDIGCRNILRIVADSALGLVEIHKKNSVHSNMRAQNVFVTARGRGILGGFGLTKALKNHATGRLPSVEQTGQALPYRWMAPECHSFGPGRPDVTVANDVWGWAMTALEIITGAPPIRRIPGDMALPCAKIEEFDMTKQRDVYPEWEQYAHKPDLLWSLLSRCWDLDETKRPDMQTVSDEIEKIVAQP